MSEPRENGEVQGRWKMVDVDEQRLSTGVIVSYALRREKRPDFRFLLVTIGGVFSHLSYDVLAGSGQFPILSPFYLGSYSFPYLSWILLEVGACLANIGVAMRLRQKPTFAMHS